MKRLLSCEFNFDTVCVELKFSDGTMIAIDTIAVENEAADIFCGYFVVMVFTKKEDTR